MLGLEKRAVRWGLRGPGSKGGFHEDEGGKLGGIGLPLCLPAVSGSSQRGPQGVSLRLGLERGSPGRSSEGWSESEGPDSGDKG